MSLLLQFLIAAISIAGLMLLRIFAERYVLRDRLHGKRAEADCEQIGCFHDCDRGEDSPKPNLDVKRKLHERSAHHAS